MEVKNARKVETPDIEECSLDDCVLIYSEHPLSAAPLTLRCQLICFRIATHCNLPGGGVEKRGLVTEAAAPASSPTYT